MEGSDVCFAPVLSMEEAPNHPQNVARKTFVEIDGVIQPAPAPRFSRTVPEISRPPAEVGADTEGTLRSWGFSSEEIGRLVEANAIVSAR